MRRATSPAPRRGCANAWRRCGANGRRPHLAITLSSLGSMLDFQGRHAEALPVHREALALARRLGARYTEVEVAINLLWCLPELDMHDEAMAAGEHALALGDCDATPTLLNNLAWLYLDCGRLDDAARVYAQLATGDDPTLACVAQAKLLQIHAQQSRADDASASAQALLAMLPRTDHPQGHAIAVLALLDHGPPALHAQALRYLPKVPVEADLQARLDSALCAARPGRRGRQARGSVVNRRLDREALGDLAAAVGAFQLHAETPQPRHVAQHLLRGIVQRPVVVLEVAQRE